MPFASVCYAVLNRLTVGDLDRHDGGQNPEPTQRSTPDHPFDFTIIPAKPLFLILSVIRQLELLPLTNRVLFVSSVSDTDGNDL
jgi:hypothetical protein